MSFLALPGFDDLDWLHAGVTTRAGETAFLDPASAWSPAPRPLAHVTASGTGPRPPIRAVAAARQVHGAGVIAVAGPPVEGSARLPGDPIDRAGAPERVPSGAGRPGTAPSGTPWSAAAPLVDGWRFGDADALMTRLPGIVLAVSVADCLPVTVVDPARRVIGVAHAGWRGLAAGVVTALVGSMRAEHGSDPGQCRAALGPAIGPCCYEVGDEVVRSLHEAGRDPALAAPRRGPRAFLDLQATALRELEAAGMAPSRATRLRECTSCHPERYFSFRRDGAILGRMWGFAAILGPGDPP